MKEKSFKELSKEEKRSIAAEAMDKVLMRDEELTEVEDKCLKWLNKQVNG